MIKPHMLAFADPALVSFLWMAVISAIIGSLFYFRMPRNRIVELVKKLFL
jgi:hypothetical protein